LTESIKGISTVNYNGKSTLANAVGDQAKKTPVAGEMHSIMFPMSVNDIRLERLGLCSPSGRTVQGHPYN
jgi:hypothetical protein